MTDTPKPQSKSEMKRVAIQNEAKPLTNEELGALSQHFTDYHITRVEINAEILHSLIAQARRANELECEVVNLSLHHKAIGENRKLKSEIADLKAQAEELGRVLATTRDDREKAETERDRLRACLGECENGLTEVDIREGADGWWLYIGLSCIHRDKFGPVVWSNISDAVRRMKEALASLRKLTGGT